MQNPLAKMTRARAELVMEQPFFGSIVLKLQLREDRNSPTMWTDGKVLGFNPQYVDAMSLERVKGLQAHEVMHLACQHHTRRKGRDEGLWNKACDYAINGVLTDAGFSLPEGFLDAPEYRDMAVDDIYAVLSRLQEEQKGGGTGDGPQEGADFSDAASGSGEGGDQEFEGDIEEHGTGEPPDKDAMTDEDSRSAGTEQQSDDTGTMGPSVEQPPAGEVRDHPLLNNDPSESGQERAERDMRIALGQAVQQAKGMGDLPAGLERLVREAVRPQLDWKTLLRQFMQACTANDYSWTPPNRRYVHLDLHFPSLRSQELAEIVVAVDSSGSVDDRLLALFSAELSAILEDFDTTLRVLYVDAAVQERHCLSRWDLPLQLVPKGGGGTDYRPAFAEVQALHIQPACLIYLTDLECNRFPGSPDYPVLWVTPKRQAQTPPFGQVLYIA